MRQKNGEEETKSGADTIAIAFSLPLSPESWKRQWCCWLTGCILWLSVPSPFLCLVWFAIPQPPPSFMNTFHFWCHRTCCVVSIVPEQPKMQKDNSLDRSVPKGSHRNTRRERVYERNGTEPVPYLRSACLGRITSGRASVANELPWLVLIESRESCVVRFTRCFVCIPAEQVEQSMCGGRAWLSTASGTRNG